MLWRNYPSPKVKWACYCHCEHNLCCSLMVAEPKEGVLEIQWSLGERNRRAELCCIDPFIRKDQNQNRHWTLTNQPFFPTQMNTQWANLHAVNVSHVSSSVNAIKLPHVSPVCLSKTLPESARGKGPMLQVISGSSSQKIPSARTEVCPRMQARKWKHREGDGKEGEKPWVLIHTARQPTQNEWSWVLRLAATHQTFESYKDSRRTKQESINMCWGALDFLPA